jgi:predicted ester cyclase
MSTESDKEIVRCYFEEVLDKRNLDVLDEIIATDCIIHRPEASEPIRGLEDFKRALVRILNVYSEFTTKIHDLIAEEDRVACRLSHRAVNRDNWTSRLGLGGGKDGHVASNRNFSNSRSEDYGRMGQSGRAWHADRSRRPESSWAI